MRKKTGLTWYVGVRPTTPSRVSLKTPRHPRKALPPRRLWVSCQASVKQATTLQKRCRQICEAPFEGYFHHDGLRVWMAQPMTTILRAPHHKLRSHL